MKILTILGARPQFIKAAAVSRAIRKHNAQIHNKAIHEVIVHTGQHFDANMSDVFFKQLNIPLPNHNLGIANLSHGAMTGRMLEQIEVTINKEKPDWVLVYGDTNSTLAGALAASKLNVPVAHVEAGLRSHNMLMPEEINRVLTDRVSRILFCPTQAAVCNLITEGYPFSLHKESLQIVINVGDVMFDVTCYYRERAVETVNYSNWGLKEKQYALCTLHRAENTNDLERLKAILSALREISKKCQVVLPLHPRTRNILATQGNQHWLDGLMTLDPLSYLEMQRLEMGAYSILTDSGGIQKEAFFHKVPCITLRDETEWIETVELGWNHIVGANRELITAAFNKIEPPSAQSEAPYGVGDAAERIVTKLCEEA
jgi:UDP-GlcNAc3NAcA epimerase